MIPGIVASGRRSPPIAPDTGDPYYDDVVSLLHFDGSNGSTTFTDEKGITWTASGNAALSTATPKFGSAAAAFDGTDDLIDAAANAGFTFGIDDYTIELWGRFASLVGNRFLAAFGSNRGIYNFNIGTPTLAYFDGAANQCTLAGGHAINTYYHIALCRAAGITRLFRDGTASADFADSSNINTTNFRLGSQTTGAGDLEGLIDELRITRRARYTAAFTPPTEAFPNVRAALSDPHYASVVALLNFEGANGQTWFLDERGNKWTRNGSPVLDTAQTPGFGTSSLSDPASTAYITTASKAAFGYGTGDFTIEFFARPSNVTGVKTWYDQRTALNQTRPAIYASGDSLRYFVSNADRITGAAGSVVINTWHHIALSRASGSTRLFVNGSQIGSTYADSTNYDAGLIVLGQAGDSLAGAFGFQGHYKGLRVTNGVARYTSNFTPPAALFADH